VLYGAHVSTSGGILTAIGRARDLNLDAAQIFTQSSRMWRPTNHDPADLAAYAATARVAGVRYTLCHAIYFINLASQDAEIARKSLEALLSTSRVAAAIDADVVLHVGSHRGAGLDATMPLIDQALQAALEVLAAAGRWLLLENSAGAGDTIGRDVDQLARIITTVAHPRLGICLDTCHIYVSGVDIGEPATLDGFLARLDGEIGLARLRALHVNDAAAALGSNRDRHANLLEGALGERMAVVLGHPALQALPAILETPGADGHGSDTAEVARLRALHAAGITQRRAAVS
jgi:deoxyribonuclease IV